MFDYDWFNELAAIQKEVTQAWIDVNARLGTWTIYGTPHKYELAAKQHAGRLFVFKKGVKVKKLSNSYVVMFWETF